MSISDMRSLLKKMAVLLDGYQQRVSTDDILAISKSIEKSMLCKSCIQLFCFKCGMCHFIHVHKSVRDCGSLFDMWLDLMGSYTSHRQIKSHQRENDFVKLPADVQQEILLREKVKFHGFILSAIHNMGNKGKGQMFFLSFTARFHGLSNMGQDIISRYGFMMKPTMFVQERAQTLSDYDDQTR
jgi:hypothetical protein